MNSHVFASVLDFEVEDLGGKRKSKKDSQEAGDGGGMYDGWVVVGGCTLLFTMD